MSKWTWKDNVLWMDDVGIEMKSEVDAAAVATTHNSTEPFDLCSEGHVITPEESRRQFGHPRRVTPTSQIAAEAEGEGCTCGYERLISCPIHGAVYFRAAQASEPWPQQLQKYFKHCDVAFFLKMESELELNQHKGNWRDWNPSRADLLSELRHHISKLVNAINANLDTTESAADVANLCMKAATMKEQG